MPPKIPSTAIPEPAPDAALSARLAYAWNLLGTRLEESIEAGLDAVLGKANEDALRDEALVRKKQLSKRRQKKKLLKELEKAKAAEEALQKEYESTLKSERLAARIREVEAEVKEREENLKESEARNKQLILQFTLVQVASLYAVSQACLLCIFVPQKCPAFTAPNYTSPWFTYPVSEPDGHLCSLKENLDWANDSPFNRQVFVFNCLTLGMMLISQSYFWKREVWFVEHLEEDTSVAYDRLPEELKGFEDFEAMVAQLNLGAYLYGSFLLLMILGNFGISAVFLIKGDGTYNYSLGSRTITGLMTNTMLVSTKIMGFWSYARLSYEKAWAISLFTVIPLSYNRVDDEFKPFHIKTVEELQAEVDLEEFPPRPAEWGMHHAEAEDDMA